MREQSIFIEALDRLDPAERAAYLDRACAGDPDLRGRIERLFRRLEETGDFLDRPPSWAAEAVAAPAPTDADRVIGPYKLLEPIGEGGMGTVYMAEQTEPVRRRVALKVIKAGMDSKQVVARFEAERQALAMMDHPNIARVLDAGMTPAGRPYFVMELVRGLPITEYCDREELTIPERLELFVLVCRAVQHAHQKGVIHRDLKPSNVLVTVIDGVAVPKVIDFGVAKATGPALTDKTLFTGFHQFVGTPLYVSPEQADLAGTDVDTRSDIYSLGVLLYELLTGTTPFDSETLKRAAFDEMRRMIREEEPPRPSTRLSTLGERLSTVSARRKADPRRFGTSLKGELDWVVMKALEKDRRRRYETANDFAADVMNYLADRPVEACPPTAWYRARKFAGRNRVVMVTSALVVLSLLAGTVVSTWQAVVAARARRQTAEALATARVAVDEMYTQVAERWLAQQPGLTPLQQEFMEKALAIYEQISDEQADDSQMQLEAARARSKIAMIHLRLGRSELAERDFRRSIEQLEDLVERDPDQGMYQRELALTLGNYTLQLRGLDRLPEAEAISARAVAHAEKVLARQPKDERARCDLAFGLSRRGTILYFLDRAGDAEVVFRRCRDLFAEHIQTKEAEPPCRNKYADCVMMLGILMNVRGDTAGAERSYRDAFEVQEALSKEFPENHEFLYFACLTLVNLAGVEKLSGRVEESLATYKTASDRLGDLVQRFPDHRRYAGSLVECLTNYFKTLREAGPADEAERIGRRGLDLADQLVRDHPGIPEHRRDLFKLTYVLADFYSIPPDGRPVEPEKALELASRAAELGPEREMALQSLGWARCRAGDWRGCIEALEKSSSYPKSADFFAAMAYWHLGDQAKARELFNRHSDWLNRYEKRWNPGVYPNPAMFRRVQAEAAALLGVEPLRGGAP